MGRYLLRLMVYIVIFLGTFTVSSVVVLRWVPVLVTPYKIVQAWDNRKEYGTRVNVKWTALERISPYMPKAVIATEDNNFFKHNGFDVEAIRRAMEENREGRRVRGASTISQQTAKNVFCTSSRTWLRKGMESYYTVLIEALWNKRRIMEVYLNVIETAPNVYGVEAAARKFYGKEAGSLNLNEASMIATVLPNPARMSLAAPSNYMIRRASQVRSLMAKLPDPVF